MSRIGKYSKSLIITFLLNYISEVKLLSEGHSRDATENEFPCFASLVQTVPRFRAFCSGTIISGVHVLTTANCISKYPMEKTTVYAGSNIFFRRETHRIAKWTKYSDWARENNEGYVWRDVDIAIIRLSNRLHFDDKVGLALLPFDYNVPIDRIKVSFVGWPNAHGYKGMALQTESVEILTSQECKPVVSGGVYWMITEKMLFCTVVGPYFNKVDEGGPVLYNGRILVGINTLRKLRDSRPPVNLHINYLRYKGFIQSVISEE